MPSIVGRLVLPSAVVSGRVEVKDGRIFSVAVDETTQSARTLREEPLVLPGLVDLHVHGGGGASFDGSTDDARRAAQFHLRHGTTTTLASLVAAPVERLQRAARNLAGLCASGEIAGIHMEGPFLSPLRCGAQDRRFFALPDVRTVECLDEAGQRHLRMMTLAPELPGAIDVISALVSRGAIAAVGHTDATFAQTRAALAAGATVATHLFNGMRGIHHREGGPVVAMLNASSAICELIVDRHHMSDHIVQLMFAVLGADRLALVTDATAAAGCPDGRYRLGEQQVDVRDGIARLQDGSSLAGSTLTMNAAVRNAVDIGIPLPDAVRAASLTPARILGRDDIGSIEVGKQADLVVMDKSIQPVRVMRAGQWL